VEKVGKPLVQVENMGVKLATNGSCFKLHVPSLSIYAGDRLAIIGESGSGKSTLLDVLSLVRTASYATKFQACFNDIEYNLSPNTDKVETSQINQLRRNYIGYVPQIGGLVSALTVWENIVMPMRLRQINDLKGAHEITRRLKLDDQLEKLPKNLSVGQRQRVAIARSLCASPKLIAADEPTAALDPVNASQALDALIDCSEFTQSALLVVTHNADQLAKRGFKFIQPSIEVRAEGAEICSSFSLVA